MTTTQNTEVSVLAHHGIVAAGGQNLIDVARDAGLISACLGCGSVTGIDAKGDLFYALHEFRTQEQARSDTRDALLDADPHAFDCCPDADTIIY